MRVVTQNSVYTVKVEENGFMIERTASMWGQPVVARHRHFSPSIALAVGKPLFTTMLHTTNVVAILA